MRTHKMIVGLLLGVGILWALGLMLLPAQAAPHPLPPRPDDTPTPTRESAAPVKAEPKGAFIILKVTFGDNWPERGLAWQHLWTGVEWRDESGTWRAVEGWQGGIVKVSESTGRKTWWLDSDLCGRGPFRWVVYEHQGGPVMTRSDPFNLPHNTGETVTVEMSLAP